jgi:multicomponent Na+:H+ antiporter subunit B
MMKKIVYHTIFLILLAFLTLPIFVAYNPWPQTARDVLVAHGEEDTGATNLVSAIYLGYRAFDTMGETIVLVVAIIGTMSVVQSVKTISENPTIPVTFDFSLKEEKRVSHKMRTHLLEVVTGKLGPIILLFGFYVMMHGHISPGGGFQGGVIIASGILFFILGNPYNKEVEQKQNVILGRLEAISFILFVLFALSSIGSSSGFFSNPFASIGLKSEYYIIALNSIIGLKVGSGISLMCIAMITRRWV